MYIAPIPVKQTAAFRVNVDRRNAFPLAWILLAMAGSAAVILGLLVDTRIAVHLLTRAAPAVGGWGWGVGLGRARGEEGG